MKAQKHRGLIVKQRIEESFLPKEKIATYIGYTRAHLYNFFEKPDLSFDIIRRIGEVIKYDFTIDFTDMPILEEAPKIHIKQLPDVSAAECLEKYAELHARYLRLLEDYKEISDRILKIEKKKQ